MFQCGSIDLKIRYKTVPVLQMRALRHGDCHPAAGDSFQHSSRFAIVSAAASMQLDSQHTLGRHSASVKPAPACARRGLPSDCAADKTVRRQLLIDISHMGRRATGIERITRELFCNSALGDLPVRYSSAPKSRLAIAITQNLGFLLDALRHPNDVLVFPGFPPSPLLPRARERCVLYVHDLFLLTRRHDLNAAGKYYMAPAFGVAVRRLKHFLVNSEETGRALRAYCRTDAEIRLYRPAVRNIFGLGIADRTERQPEPPILRAVAIGSIEPRKNFQAAANICAALEARIGRPVELHLIGRIAWGGDHRALVRQPGVILHGSIADTQARRVIESADFLICTSHDEGLGLPLLEVQHGGLPIVAPEGPIFREVLSEFRRLYRPKCTHGRR